MSGRRITLGDGSTRPVTVSVRVSSTHAYTGTHAEKIKPFPSPVLKGAHPLNGCICIWVWCPDIGGQDTPFVRKFVNASCYAHIGGG